MLTPRLCLDCGRPHVRARGRCEGCEGRERATYAGGWPAMSTRIRAEWVAEFGFVCPGWGVEPHDVEPTDLTVDHVVAGSLAGGLQVLCRACNTRKRNEVCDGGSWSGSEGGSSAPEPA